mmetsp:Transcript_64847/g.121573  ORF Transcript_64847/g.121573 Transcript_64847/m.121573 type:complete len:202 (-) Transcript_64847:131-736(-)
MRAGSATSARASLWRRRPRARWCWHGLTRRQPWRFWALPWPRLLRIRRRLPAPAAPIGASAATAAAAASSSGAVAITIFPECLLECACSGGGGGSASAAPAVLPTPVMPATSPYPAVAQHPPLPHPPAQAAASTTYALVDVGGRAVSGLRAPPVFLKRKNGQRGSDSSKLKAQVKVCKGRSAGGTCLYFTESGVLVGTGHL